MSRRWDGLSERRAAGLVLGVALGVQALFLGILPAEHRRLESTDFLSFYEPVARNIAAGEAWVAPDGTPAVRYPPGYPVFLALVFSVDRLLPGDEAFWLLAAGLLVGGLGAAAHHVLCRRLIGPRGALVASALWLSYGPWLWLVKQPNSETVFLLPFFAAVAVFAGLRVEGPGAWRGAAAVGLGLGLATLLRPVTLLLPFGLAALWICGLVGGAARTARRLRMTAVLLGVYVSVVAPWEIWAHAQVGWWIPVSTGGRLSLLDGLTVAADSDGPRPEVPADVARLMEAVQSNRPLIGGPVDAARFLVAHAAPLTLAKLLWLKSSRAWYATESLRFETALARLQAVYLLAAVIGLVALYRAGPEYRAAFWLVLSITAYFWAMTVLVLSILRYMVPAMGLLVAAAAFPLGRGLTALIPATKNDGARACGPDC